MRAIFFLSVLLAASTAQAQNFRYFDAYGNVIYGQSFQNGGWVADPYGNRAVWQYYQPYRVWQPPVIYVNPSYGVWQTPNPWFNYYGGW